MSADIAKGRDIGPISVHNERKMKRGRMYMVDLPTPRLATCRILEPTAHMSWDKSFFVTYAPSTNQRISVGDAHDIPVNRLGSVQLRVKLPNRYHTVTL